MKLRLLAKMVLFILLPAIAGLVILSVVSGQLAQQGMRVQIEEELTLSTGVQASEVYNILQMLQRVTINLSEVPSINEALLAHDEGKATPELLQAAEVALHDVRRNFVRIRDAGIIAPNGVVLVHTAPGFAGQSLKERVYFAESMQGRPSKAVVVSRATNTSTYILSAPAKQGNKVLGVVYVSIEIEKLAETTTNNLKVGRTGYCFVLTGEGGVIIHPEKDKIGLDIKQMPWVKPIIEGTSGIVHYAQDGVERMAYFTTMQFTGWKVVLSAEEDDLMSAVIQMRYTNMILTLCISLLVGGIILYIARGMASVLRGCASVSQYVAEGNLVLTAKQKQELATDSRRSDEIGNLARALDTMIQNLGRLFAESDAKTREAEEATRKAVIATEAATESAHRAENAKRDGMLTAADQLAGAVTVIMSAAEQLSSQIAQSERGAADQASRVTSTATAMSQMNATVLEVAKNAGDASEMSLHTRRRAEAGAKVVHQAVGSIQAVQKQAGQLREGMTELDENARSISQIMGVISDIADQTNLLALNAAIEAARAGEAGRGFAVVADEVRKLAEKTMASTTDVAQAIKRIQNSASTSLSQVELSGQTIEEATGFANQSGEALSEIVSMMDGAADQVRAIATAAEQQSATSEEINRSIGEVNFIAVETAETMRQASRAVEELSRQAHLLNNLIDDMRKG